jgi:hypothetical protein
MFLSLYDKVTNVLCVSHLSHDRYKYNSVTLSRPEQILINTCNSCCDVNGADVVMTSRNNARKQTFIFPLRYYANCVSTMLTVFIMLKGSISFIVTLYFNHIIFWDHRHTHGPSSTKTSLCSTWLYKNLAV